MYQKDIRHLLEHFSDQFGSLDERYPVHLARPATKRGAVHRASGTPQPLGWSFSPVVERIQAGLVKIGQALFAPGIAAGALSRQRETGPRSNDPNWPEKALDQNTLKSGITASTRIARPALNDLIEVIIGSSRHDSDCG